jgi:hypothetical protein
MSIQQFKGSLTGGGARQNQFRVQLAFPTAASVGGSAASKAEFLCSAASLPGSTIGVTPVQFRGRNVPLAGERTFQPWTIQCINDTDFALRDAFEKWMEKINGVKDNTGITNPNLYGAQLAVHQLDRNGSTIKTYTFIDAWPSDIGEIQLDFGANNQVEVFPVTLQYSYWETKTTSSGVSANVGIATPFGSVSL